MNVDTKLRGAGKAVRDARRGEFTVRPPSTRRRRINGPALAAGTALLVIAAIGVPAFLASSPSSAPAGTEPDAFPYLGLELADSVVYDAYDVTDDVTGEVVGTHIEYLQTWTRESREDVGRVTELRVQREGHDYARFDELVAASTSSSAVQVGDREVTVYAIPDDATDECCYDLGVLRWAETPGIEVLVIPWGLNTKEAVELLDGIHPLGAAEWNELIEDNGLIEDGAPTTTTTVTTHEGAPTPTPSDA